MRVLRHLKHFASTSSIHGLAYIVRPNGTTRSKICWALVFVAAVLYASLELRKQVFCKLCEKLVKSFAWIINIFFSCLYSLVYPSSKISCCYNTSRRRDVSGCNHLPLQLKSGSMGNSSENLRPHENQVWIKEVNEIVIRLRTVYILCNGFWENKYFVLPTLNVT